MVKVKVMEVDAERKRIALSMRLDEKPSEKSTNRTTSKTTGGKPTQNGGGKPQNRAKQKPQPANAAMGNALADAFAKLKK